jgi:hypothetical protein
MLMGLVPHQAPDGLPADYRDVALMQIVPHQARLALPVNLLAVYLTIARVVCTERFRPFACTYSATLRLGVEPQNCDSSMEEQQAELNWRAGLPIPTRIQLFSPYD